MDALLCHAVFDWYGLNKLRVHDWLLGHASIGSNNIYPFVSLMKQIDRLRGDLDQSGSMDALDSYTQQAIDLITGGLLMPGYAKSEAPYDTQAPLVVWTRP